jgi:hypothetical protein
LDCFIYSTTGAGTTGLDYRVLISGLKCKLKQISVNSSSGGGSSHPIGQHLLQQPRMYRKENFEAEGRKNRKFSASSRLVKSSA